MNESPLGTIHFSVTILQYRHNIDLQHSRSLPSSPKQRPDQFTTTLSQLGRGRAGGRFVSVSPPLASRVLTSKVSEFTRAPRSSAAVGPGGQKRQAKQAKTGGVPIAWDSQWAEELVMKRCHTCHYLSLPKTLYSAVVPKQHQCSESERFTSYCPPLIQNTPSFWEQLHRQLQSSFSRTRPLMFTKLCVLQDFLTSARLHPCRMWVFTATAKLVTANTFWLECEVNVQLNSRPKLS